MFELVDIERKLARDPGQRDVGLYAAQLKYSVLRRLLPVVVTVGRRAGSRQTGRLALPSKRRDVVPRDLGG
jgi:hypothetical protein